MDIEQKAIQVTVKWNKDSYLLDMTEGEDIDSFRVKLYSITQVLPDKQKLLFKGKFLKEGSQTLRQAGLCDVSLKEKPDNPYGPAGNSGTYPAAKLRPATRSAGLLRRLDSRSQG